MMNNTGKRIHWAGDMANGAQSGTIIADDGSWMTIKWDGGGTLKGRTERAPSALVNSPRFSVFEIELPARCTVLVYQSEQYPGEWIVKTNITTRDVETGEQGMFGATRYFVPAKGKTKTRKPSMRQVARAVFDSLRHEVEEQLGLNPHKTGARK